MTDTAAQGDPVLIPVLSASNFVIGMGAFVVIGLLGPLSQDLSLSTSEAGWIMTVYALSYAVLSPLLVSMTGAVGRRRVMAGGLATFAVANAVMAFAPEATWVFIARVMAAAGAGVVTPVTAAVAVAVSAPEHRGRALSAVFVGMTLAQVLGVPVGSFIAYTFGWRVAFGVVVLLALPCIWLIWTRVPKGLKFQPVTLSHLGKTLRNGPVMLAVLFTATFMGAVWVVYTYFGPLLAQTMGYGRNGITLVLLVFGIGAVVGNWLGGRASDRFGPSKTLIMLSASQIVWLALYSFLPMPQSVLFGLVFLHSVCGWSFMAGQQARIVALAPESAQVVLSLNAAAIYIGAAVGSAIGGAVIDHSGLIALGWTGSVVAVVAALHMILSTRISGDYRA